jgi:uncharacterized protein (TIGR02996 family)
MGSALAIISKAIFEKLPETDLGAVVGFDRYASTHKTLDTLADGGALYLVTVRPGEQLWLVGVLAGPAKKKDGWYATNATPIRDITSLIDKFVFANGKGLTAKPGALGMSLQTPRALADEDVGLLRGGKATAKSTATKPVAKSTAAKPAAKSTAPKPAAKLAAKSTSAKPAAKSTSAKPAAKSTSATKSAPTSTAVDLDAIANALADDDAASALEAALVAWRATRATSLAELIDVLGTKIEAPSISDEGEWGTAARTRDAATLTRVLAAITELPVSFLPQAAEMLAAYPDDPRLALAVANWTLEPPTMSSSMHSFWTKSFDALARIADPRVLPILKSRLRRKPGGGSQFWGKLYKGIEKALPKVAAATVTAVDEKAVAKLAKTAGKLVIAAPSKPAKVKKTSGPKLDGPPLGQALAHLEAGRVAAAIDALVVAWRVGKQPALADTIDRATKLLPAYDAPLGMTDKEVIAAWDAAYAGDPQGTLPQLLQNLVVGGAKVAERHLLDLAALPEDPRIAMRLAALCCGSTASPERTQFWKSLLEQIARIADPRTANELCLMFREFEGDYYNHHRQARRIIGDWALKPPEPPALGPSETAALAKIEAQLGKLEAKRDTTERDLVNAICDGWDDNAARLVYADWLTERQHPRGEVIVLACKEQRSAAEDKRLQELFKKTSNLYGLLEEMSEAWYSSRQVGLVRGMPTKLVVRWDANPFVWLALVGYPLLATIEEIVFEENAYVPMSKDLAAVLLDPTARRLAKVTDLPQEHWKQLKDRVDGAWKQKGTTIVRASAA